MIKIKCRVNNDQAIKLPHYQKYRSIVLTSILIEYYLSQVEEIKVFVEHQKIEKIRFIWKLLKN